MSFLKKPEGLLKLHSPILHSLFRDCFLQEGENLRPGFKANESLCLKLDSEETDMAFLKLYGLRL